MVVEEWAVVPGHPQRRPHARGGRSRRSARGRRARAAQAPLQQGDPPRGRRRRSATSCSNCSIRELEIDPRNVSRHRALLDLSCLWQLHGTRPPRAEGSRPGRRSRRAASLLAEGTDRPIFSVMRDRAVLMHHPYESFSSSVEVFLEQAADDPRVQSIKMTLYRAGGDSPVIQQPDPRRRARQAGRGARRAQGPFRRGQQRAVGQAARACRRARRLRHGRAQDPLQGRCSSCATTAISCAGTATSAPATTTRRPPGSTRTSGSSPATTRSVPTPRSCSTTSPGYSRSEDYRDAARRAARPASVS